MLPEKFLYGQYDLRKRWLACQRVTLVPMVASIFGSILLVPLCYIFMYSCNFGLSGLAFAAFVKEAIVLTTTVTYSYCKSEIRAVMQPYDSEVFRGWGAYLKISLPATVMICSEWWAFELVVVMAGIMGVIELASMTICMTVQAWTYMIPLGI